MIPHFGKPPYFDEVGTPGTLAYEYYRDSLGFRVRLSAAWAFVVGSPLF